MSRHCTEPVALVAGGAGFLGSHFCERLLGEGFRVICLDSLLTGSADNLQAFEREPRFSFMEQDVCDPLPASLVADRVYNLACAASPRHYQADPVHTMMTSVVGTRNLLEVALRSGGRMLQASTSEVYGDPEEHPQRESYRGSVNPIGIRACYDEGKRAAEALCFDYRRRDRVDIRVARIFNTYGPRMQADDGRVVSNFVCQALAGRPLTIYGSGEQTRSFCYVSDLVEGLSRLIGVDANPECPVNIGNPEEFTLNELARLVLSLTGSQSRTVHEPLPADDPRCRRPDISRARMLLDWRPSVPLAAGLMRTIPWFVEHGAEPAVGASAPALPRRVAVPGLMMGAK